MGETAELNLLTAKKKKWSQENEQDTNPYANKLLVKARNKLSMKLMKYMLFWLCPDSGQIFKAETASSTVGSVWKYETFMEILWNVQEWQ